MKRITGSCLLSLILFISLNSCMTFTDFQSAKTVGKGNFEITPNFTMEFNKEFRYPNLGFNLDYGVTDRFDMRASFSGGIINLLSLAPKFNLIKDRFSITMPVGTFLANKDLDIDRVWVYQPTLLMTMPIRESLDLTFAPKWVFLKNTQGWEKPEFAPNIGLSYHRPGSFVTYRPEVGVSFMYTTMDVHVGMAVAFKLEKRAKTTRPSEN